MSEQWEIDWYICCADASDVARSPELALGDELWRVPLSIGPISADHNHWAGEHLSLEPGEAERLAICMKACEGVDEKSLAQVSVRELIQGFLDLFNATYPEVGKRCAPSDEALSQAAALLEPFLTTGLGLRHD